MSREIKGGLPNLAGEGGKGSANVKMSRHPKEQYCTGHSIRTYVMVYVTWCDVDVVKNKRVESNFLKRKIKDHFGDGSGSSDHG